MFVSHEKNGKKTFQKPNILRRRPKVSATRSNTSKVNESLGRKSVVANTHVTKIADQYIQQIDIHEESKKPITKSLLKLEIANNNIEEDEDKPQETDIDANVISHATVSSNIVEINYEDKSLEQSSLNIESFLNGASPEESLPSNIDVTACSEKKTHPKIKWGFDVTNSPMDIIVNNYTVPQLSVTEQKSEFIIDVVPPVNTTSVQSAKQLHEVIYSPTPNRTVSVELFSNRAVKFKCDEPNCCKGFWSEERLKKHKNSHNRQSTVRAPSQVTIECPVKKILDDGSEDKCPQTFQARRDLLKHLNTEHTPEDALHRCEVCGRRFFWASGLRAHAQSLCARGGLACSWPGCDRVFRLPCRLREHARAHTGDRPYLCKYPECGWAFRSASKLVRHARRHTDERRHGCAACGRAFLRREHLRDHAARHHARPAHRCHHAGCEQTFTNMSTLYMHMKKVHRKDESGSVTPAVVEQPVSVADTSENIYLVSVVERAEDEGAGAAGGAGRAGGAGAARTHCTWPLAPRALADPAFVLEEDVHMENADCSTSNVYTVRSDLFLHGNVPIDDDSQNIGGAQIEGSETAAPLDTDLCLIDSHPTIDLMQEELMYDDAAVDESSFRVFLLNGEELS